MSDLTYLRLKERLTLQAEEQGIPLSGGFELTARCNFQCGMCYVQRPVNDSFAIKHELSAEQWIDLAKQARDAGMLYVLLTGGDIFVRKDIQQIYENVFDLGLIPTIYTNGSLIRPDIVRWLQKRPPQTIDITLYGASPEMYRRVCGVEGGYGKVLRNLDLLLDAGLNLGLSTTVIEKNVTEYEALLKIAEDRNLALRFCGYISPVKRDTGEKIAARRLSPERLAEYSSYFNEQFEKRHKDIMHSPEFNPERDKKDCSVDNQPEKGRSQFWCSAGKTMTWLNWRGEMSGCSLMTELYTEPLKEGFEEGWSRLKKLMFEVPECLECEICQYKKNCIACPVRLKAETGRYEKSSEYLCRLAKY